MFLAVVICRFDCDRFEHVRFQRSLRSWRLPPTLGSLDALVTVGVYVLFVVTFGYVIWTNLNQLYFCCWAVFAIAMFCCGV